MSLTITIPNFPLDREHIQQCIDAIDPIRYGKSRNYTNGAVTYLSPYISRGFITIAEIRDQVLARGYQPHQIEQFLKELAWREYFLRVWESLGTDGLMKDIRFDQENVRSYDVPRVFSEKNTGIEAFDQGIQILEQYGYMHNHLRMYLAGTITNISHAYWKNSSLWMYYHLLDGDLASNSCSWQWNAGVFSSKKYLANQENINQYTGSLQRKTFLDVSYEKLEMITPPDNFFEYSPFSQKTPLPIVEPTEFDFEKPLCIYTNYWINPNWLSDIDANRILVLSPSHFQNFPVSQKVIDFIVGLATTNIEGIQIYVGEIEELRDAFRQSSTKDIYLIDHILYKDITGIIKTPYPYMIPEVSGFFSSFFSYWKKAEKYR